MDTSLNMYTDKANTVRFLLSRTNGSKPYKAKADIRFQKSINFQPLSSN